mgnify:CR=1 FL=1
MGGPPVLGGGEMAEFVVYPQGQAGARCEIIRQSYTEEQIDGFVLVELVKDRALCEKIYTGSGLDVLGRFDQDSAQKRLEEFSRTSSFFPALRTSASLTASSLMSLLLSRLAQA